MAAPASATLSKSSLTQQLEHDDGQTTPKSNKLRSFSDVPSKPSLSPSPAIRETSQRVSKDDNAVTTDPVTPRRPYFHMRGLSLQMPAKDESGGSNIARIPLSPKLDPSSTYGSPASVLPRRSRGLDFARACSTLHHSTLAESSPDASPITGRGINIPQRRGIGYSNPITESPSQGPSLWSNGEKTTLSSSVSSINMMDSDSDSDVSSEDMAIDREAEDQMLNTPAASRINGLMVTNSPGMEWLNNNNPSSSQLGLLNFQPNRLSFRRARMRHNKSSHSSSSVSMRSSKPSPGPLSPPIRPSVESPGYFELTRQQVRSRRESLSLGTDDLRLSDSEWDNSTRPRSGTSGNDGSSERGVIKRAVTRRSNLLPKTKGFARIKAALMEESDPLHSEARREAEVIKQVHESDAYDTSTGTLLENTSGPEPLQASIEITNPNDLSLETSRDSETSDMPSTEAFSEQAKRNSGGLNFWDNFEHTPPNNIDRYRTPPPPTLTHQESNTSDDTMASTNALLLDTNQNPSLLRQLHQHRSRSRSTTPLASVAASQAVHNVQNAQHPPSAADVVRKVNNKRRRDDDFDPASFKRRAVSPGMASSAQSSPVVPQSPTLTSDKAWGRPPPKTPGDRSNSMSSTSNNGPKRVGLQGMTEASDGFMSMSID